MQELPVSYPESIFDWVAYREIHRNDLASLDFETLATLYGMSMLVEYRDEALLRAVESMMDAAVEPVRMRYELACMIGNYFGGDHAMWAYGHDLKPGDPGYVGEIPRELYEIVVKWICEGIVAFGIKDPQFKQVRNIAARFAGGYTFLEKGDIDRFREVSGDPLDWRIDPDAQGRIAGAIAAINRLANESRPPDSE